jgi:hypothetical protein
MEKSLQRISASNSGMSFFTSAIEWATAEEITAEEEKFGLDNAL